MEGSGRKVAGATREGEKREEDASETRTSPKVPILVKTLAGKSNPTVVFLWCGLLGS